MFKMYYKNFGLGMMRDIETMNNNGIRVNAGYDGEMKMYYIKTNDRNYNKNIWYKQFEEGV